MSDPVRSEASASDPGFGQVVGRIAYVIAADDFPTGERARLKRLDPSGTPNLAFYRFAFRHLPKGWESRQAAWITLIAGIALMGQSAHNPNRPAGQALAEARYAEARLERLLAAEGETLHVLVLRAARFLAAKNDACNWVDLAYLLGLRGDSERTRMNIARHYYRHLTEKDKE
jgi:CRISPR system Cascade subunit CasB